MKHRRNDIENHKKKYHGLQRVIMGVILRSKWFSMLLLFCMMGSVVFTLIPPLVLERVVDGLTVGASVTLQLAFLYFGTLVISGLLDAVKEMLITIFGQKITHGLRSEMCHKLSHIHASYFIQQESGKTTSRMVNDVDTVEQLFTQGIIGMGVDVCKVLSIIVVIFTKSRGLGVLLLITAPILFLITRIFQRKMLTAQMKNRVAIGKVTKFIPETIANIRTIHCLVKEKYMEDRYDESIQESYHAVNRANIYDSLYSPIVMLIRAVLVGTLMVLSVMNGQAQQFFGMSVGTAVAIIAYVGKVFAPIESIGMEIQNIQSAVAGVKRINELLEEREKPQMADEVQKERWIDENEELRKRVQMPTEAKRDNKWKEQMQRTTQTDEPRTSGVAFSQVTFSYDGEQTILEELSLSIALGEHVTLAGRTGAGKSTIFRLLLGLYAPQKGSIYVMGRRAHEIPDQEKRKIFGYVEQSFHMIAGTVADQISLHDDAITMEQIQAAAKLVGLHQQILQLPEGYQSQCKRELFSQGQFQLLSIARAVVADPQIMLLDEITANLDSVTEQKVLEALERAASGRTVISISHRLYERENNRMIMIES
ncbi:MAG: ABC transporter ATP-binding protein [Lachnospiraceae bacterium]|nr:ABC transporter ATP-binding protein [Lachnospiraceae bacterium]